MERVWIRAFAGMTLREVSQHVLDRYQGKGVKSVEVWDDAGLPFSSRCGFIIANEEQHESSLSCCPSDASISLI
jgi:hypothetical protein